MKRLIGNLIPALLVWVLCVPVLQAQEEKITFNAVPVKVQKKSPTFSAINKEVSDFEVFQINTKSIGNYLKKKSNSGSFQMTFGKQVFDLTIEINDLYASNVIIRKNTGSEIIELSKVPLRTYKGYNSIPENQVRLSIDEDVFTGNIQQNGETYTIDPLKRFVKNAPINQFVFYKSKNSTTNIGCANKEVAIPGSKQQKTPTVVADCYIVQIAFFFDFPAQETAITNTSSIKECMDVLNQVDMHYEPLGIKYKATEFYFGSKNEFVDDNATSGDLEGILEDFSQWGRSGNFSNDYDVATWWKGSYGGSGEIGYAWGGSGSGRICTTQNYNLVPWSTYPFAPLMSHEVGHNWGCPHSSQIMAPTVGNIGTFDASSQLVITQSLDAIKDVCLDQCHDQEAQLDEIVSPGTSFSTCGAPGDIKVRISNTSYHPLTSGKIYYSFNGGPDQQYNWSGNLTYHQSEVVTIPNVTFPTGKNNLKVILRSPNGAVDGDTYNNEKELDFEHLSDGTPFEITFTMDGRAADIYWEISEGYYNTIQTGGQVYKNVQGGNVRKDYFCLDNRGKCYNFKITDRRGGSFSGSYTIKNLTTGTQILSGSSFSNSERHDNFFCPNEASCTKDITKVEEGNANCGPTNGKFSQEIIVTYNNPPSSGKLMLNEHEFDITSSPQTVVLTGLWADNTYGHISAYFTEGNACRVLENNLYRSKKEDECTTYCLPQYSTDCFENSRIQSIALNSEPFLNSQSETCDQIGNKNYQNFVGVIDEVELATGNEYTMEIKAFNGKYYAIWIDFNKNNIFDNSEMIYNSDDQELVRQIIKFSVPDNADLGSTVMRVRASDDRKLTSPCEWSPGGEAEDYSVKIVKCEISAITAGNQIPCEEIDNSYNQEVTVTYNAPPFSGTLNIFGQQFPITGSPQTIALDQLDANGQATDITAEFSENAACKLTKNALYVSPIKCKCDINTFAEGTRVPCDPNTNKYDQEVIITYDTEPSTGKINFNGVEYPITGSPQNFTLTDLESDSRWVDVKAFFTDKTSCELEELDFFQAPEACIPCSIDKIELGNVTSCSPTTNTFAAEVIITYAAPPKDGTIIVNGQSFPIVKSPQSIVLGGIEAKGQVIDIEVSFSSNATCALSSPGLITAPESCGRCRLKNIQLVDNSQTSCDPTTNSYSQDVTITYVFPPETGKLIVNEQEFDVLTSPQTITLADLDADGVSVNVLAGFQDDNQCEMAIGNIFTAPVSCEQCNIVDITAGVQTSCNPIDNSFSQQFIIQYRKAPTTGKLDVNGTQFDIDKSPQTVILDNLPADGLALDVTANFTDVATCTFTVDDIINAPTECRPCVITDVTAGTQSACENVNNTYSQEITITYSEAPTTGKLVVNGQEFDVSSSPQTVTIENLNSNSAPVDVNVYFTDILGCTKTFFDLFTAPIPCVISECAISTITSGTQSACDPLTNSYSQDITVTFENPPLGGFLNVNGQKFSVSTSPMTVTLNGLSSDGLNVDVTAEFTAKGACTYTENALFTAPVDCSPCKIIDVTSVSQTACLNNTYSQTLLVSYHNPPVIGDLLVNGQTFSITGSPQTISLLNLDANGGAVDVSATFSDDAICTYNSTSLFIAPIGCDPCAITIATAGTQYSCNPVTNEFRQEVTITYENAPGEGNLIVNGQSYLITSSPQTVTLSGLDANGTAVDLNTNFSFDSGCTNDFTQLFIAPENCEPCRVLNIEPSSQSVCEPVSNTYTQDIILTYDELPGYDIIVVNGQEFSITASPQTITLLDLPSNGASVSVTAAFKDDLSCSLTKTNLFTAAVSCKSCEISGITAAQQSFCNPLTNEYSQNIIVTYDNSPSTGKLIVYDQEFVITNSPQTITISGLQANSNNVSVLAKFQDLEVCQLNKINAFMAPTSCAISNICQITKIQKSTQSSCNPLTNQYTQDLIVSYSFPPASGKLVVNNQLFDITASPQQVTLKSLNADGNPVDVTANFSDASTCRLIENSLFEAPTPCNPNPCTITNIELGLQSLCDANKKYTQEVLISFLNQPNSGDMVVNGQLFGISISPQSVTLTDLVPDKVPGDVVVTFTTNRDCETKKLGIILSPNNCFIGVDQNGNEVNVQYYPNPTNGLTEFKFTGVETENASLRILSMSGQLLSEKYLGRINDGYQHQIDLTAYANGIYLIQLVSTNFILNGKIHKQ